MEFRKRLWLLYLLVTGLEIALTLFVAYFQHQSARMHQIRVELLHVSEAFYKQVVVGSIDPFGLWRINGKNCKNFLSNFLLLIWGV